MGTFATSWTTGDTIPASELNTLSGAWTSYTPTVGGTGWALGNGTISGRYKKIGRVVVAQVLVTWGTTSSAGSGALTLTAPVASGTLDTWNGGGVAWDTSGGAAAAVVTRLTGASTTITCFVSNTAGTYDSLVGIATGVPYTWASTDYVAITVVYEASS